MSPDRSPKHRRRQSLTTRVMLITGGLVIGTALVLSALAVYLLNSEVENGTRARLEIARGTAEVMVAQRVDQSTQLARWLADDAALRDAARARDLPALDTVLGRLGTTLPGSQGLIVDDAGRQLASSFDFAWDDAALVVGDALQGRTRSGLSVTRDCRLLGVAAVPIGSGAPVGAVVVSTPLAQAFVDALQARTDSSAWLMCGAGGSPSVLGAGRLEIDAALNEAVFTHAQPFTGASRVDGVLSFGSYLPLSDVNGRVVGMVGVTEPMQAVLSARDNATRLFVGVALLFAVVVMAEAYWLSRGMTRPLHALTQATQAMAEGDLTAPLDMSGDDEFAELAQTFASMRTRLSETYADLARERNRYRDFLAILPHEFRTPLAALAASLELLEMDGTALSADQRALVNSLHRSVIRLKSLVDNLLDTASIQAGQFQVAAEPNDLPAIIAQAHEFTQPLLDQKGQELQVHMAPDLPPVMADAPRLTQVLVNLISNANKYGPAGAPLRLDAAPQDRFVRVAITDYGPGIPEAEQRGLFQRYMRARNASEAGVSGMGFGLAIVREIIEQHGGQVGLESHDGEGTTVWFTVPSATGEESEAAPRSLALAS